jgi:mono/diheme cytochrome c family protein
MISRVRQIASGAIALLAVFLIIPAEAQNLDAGKTPAQIFADTCSACHRRAQELRKPSAAFLRSHYTTGQQEAATMANYLAGIPADPRAGQPKRQPGTGAVPAETVPTRRQEQSREQPKEQAKSPPAAASKGRRNGRAEAKGPAPAAAPEITSPEPPPQPAPAAPPLESFEE